MKMPRRLLRVRLEALGDWGLAARAMQKGFYLMAPLVFVRQSAQAFRTFCPARAEQKGLHSRLNFIHRR